MYMCVYAYVCISVWVPLSLSSFERLVFSDLSFPLHGLFTEIAVSKFLHGLVVVLPETFLFYPLYVLIHFSASFCMVHTALDLTRDHAPQKCPLSLSQHLHHHSSSLSIACSLTLCWFGSGRFFRYLQVEEQSSVQIHANSLQPAP